MPAKARAKRSGTSPADPIPALWLFGFDNTIARLEREVDWTGGRRVLEPYLRSVGAPADLFEKIPRGNLPLYDAYRTRLLAGTVGDDLAYDKLRGASDIIERLELAGVDRAQALEGAIETLAALRNAGAKIAIVTSNSSRTVRRWFEVNQVDAVDEIVGRDSLLGLKPAPDMVMRALKLFSDFARESVFVGDSEADLLAARASSVPFYGIAPGDQMRDRLLAAGASEIFGSPAALAIHLNLALRRV